MPALIGNIDMSALSEISDKVEGKELKKVKSEASIEQLRGVLEENEAGIKEVAFHLATQLRATDNDVIKKKAIDTILEIYGIIGTARNQDVGDKISIVVHNTQVVNGSGMFPLKQVSEPPSIDIESQE